MARLLGRYDALRVVRVGMLTGLLFVAMLLSGCGLTIPTDPNGALDRATGSILRVGASLEPGLVERTGDELHGPLVSLTERFADSIDARVEWTVAAEETLVGELESGDLDLAIGGFTDETPWVDRVGITRGYSNIAGSDERSLVFAVPLGENALLSKLESFLDKELQ
ncbi:hypothetical protein FM104_14555 [Microbacterium esteraromaticum]|uniref:ABC transporter substrate-binding protein n=1 Tax=Microbacterium esteraromaticum TaxID=57043 RepID=A0A1R4KP16_9MICO|nr:hypothetical protein [Microbacterium esteraromaticum]SJN46091.1 hypothetical protein FM104_14555 [Microbacterium esteraromaticum]